MNTQPLIIGHRGSSANAPENTIAAFTQAITDGADGIEFDVRLSSDGVPVVIHDASLKRTASINKLVSDFTCAELAKIDAGACFRGRAAEDGELTAQCVPSLEDVFRLYSESPGILYLEMKGEPVGETLPAEVVRLISKHAFADRVVVESFDLAAVAAIKKIDPSIRTASLFEPTFSERISIPSHRDLLSQAREVQADEIAVHHTLARNELIVAARRASFEVVVWTVEQEKWIGLAQRLGIKALITNDPPALLKHRGAPTSGR